MGKFASFFYQSITFSDFLGDIPKTEKIADFLKNSSLYKKIQHWVNLDEK